MNTEALVACVPNFSEGRRKEVIDAIVDSIKSVPGLSVLDVESDPDHNRSVVTILGEPEAVLEGAFRGIAKAAELIDLNRHHGTHPRIGAADVVPFIPIRGVTMADCVSLAVRLGQRVAKELGLPVYFYEEAATRPERRALENIRRGEYEGLKERIGKDPSAEPDLGPAKLGPAGAVIIGARHPLIAFNVYLDTDDVEVAKKIAEAVRYSSGGFRYVKALGMLVRGHAQISMNLTNYHKTPMYRVLEAVRREAARYGATVTHTEIIGLVPQRALLDAAKWYMQIDNLTPNLVLENRLWGEELEV